jgi:hypothetical protein
MVLLTPITYCESSLFAKLSLVLENPEFAFIGIRKDSYYTVRGGMKLLNSTDVCQKSYHYFYQIATLFMCHFMMLSLSTLYTINR